MMEALPQILGRNFEPRQAIFEIVIFEIATGLPNIYSA